MPLGRIIHPFDYRQHTLASVIADIAFFVDHPGHRHQGDAGLMGYIGHGRTSQGEWTSRREAVNATVSANMIIRDGAGFVNGTATNYTELPRKPRMTGKGDFGSRRIVTPSLVPVTTISNIQASDCRSLDQNLLKGDAHDHPLATIEASRRPPAAGSGSGCPDRGQPLAARLCRHPHTGLLPATRPLVQRSTATCWSAGPTWHGYPASGWSTAWPASRQPSARASTGTTTGRPPSNRWWKIPATGPTRPCPTFWRTA